MTNEQVIEKLEKSGDLTEFSQLVALMYFNYDSISQIVVRLKELAGNANISGEVNMRLIRLSRMLTRWLNSQTKFIKTKIAHSSLANMPTNFIILVESLSGLKKNKN